MRDRIIGKSSAARGRMRSRRSSSMRARITGKSSAARGRVTFPPNFLWVLCDLPDRNRLDQARMVEIAQIVLYIEKEVCLILQQIYIHTEVRQIDGVGSRNSRGGNPITATPVGLLSPWWAFKPDGEWDWPALVYLNVDDSTRQTYLIPRSWARTKATSMHEQGNSQG